MNSQQSGFAHALLIIGLSLALAVALGFVFWQNFIYKEPTATKTETTTSMKKEDTKATNTLSVDQVNQQLQQVYKTYIQDRKSGSTVDASLDAVKSSFTESAFTKLKNTHDAEGLTCAQNYIPDSITLTTAVEGGSATSKITRITNGQTATAPIEVVTDLTTGKISAVSCPV